MRENRRKMTRTEAREAVFSLLFETEFQKDKSPEEIYLLAREDRDIAENKYIRNTYFGILEHTEELDAIIARHANGWRTDRLSRVSRAIIRLCTYEMKYDPAIPKNVSLNEAVELTKKFDDPKAKAFVNGVLNAVKNELDGADSASAADNVPGESGESAGVTGSDEND